MFLRFMIAIVVIAVAAPFFIPGPDGTPIMSLEKFKFNKPSLPDFGGDKGTASQTLYRYQDEQGEWHYSDAKPEGTATEQIEISADINLLDATPVGSSAVAEPEVRASPLTGIARGAELMQEARAVQQLMDDRVEHLDQSLNQTR